MVEPCALQWESFKNNSLNNNYKHGRTQTYTAMYPTMQRVLTLWDLLCLQMISWKWLLPLHEKQTQIQQLSEDVQLSNVCFIFTAICPGLCNIQYMRVAKGVAHSQEKPPFRNFPHVTINLLHKHAFISMEWQAEHCAQAESTIKGDFKFDDITLKITHKKPLFPCNC